MPREDTLAMSVDTIRAVFTYLTALVTVVGSGAVILSVYGKPGAEAIVGLFGGFIGFALNFLFGAEVQARTARQSTAATLAATTAATNGGAHP
jgi:hypothetical protein